MLRAANGNNWWLLFNTQSDTTAGYCGYAEFSAAGQPLRVQRLATPAGFGHRLLDALPQADGTVIVLVQVDRDPLVGFTLPRCYVKKYTADFQEMWSVLVSERWFSMGDYPPLVQDRTGNVYGAVRKLFTANGGFTHLLFSISPNGQWRWGKVLDRFPQSLAWTLDSTLVVAFAPAEASIGSIVGRFTSSGQLLQTVRFPNVNVLDIDVFPNGQLLCMGHLYDVNQTKLLVRTTADLQTLKAWEITGFGANSERRNGLVASDTSIYYTLQAAGNERGRVLMQFSQDGMVRKAVLLSEAAGSAVSPLLQPNGQVLWCVVGTSGACGLFRHGAQLALPNCELPTYCVHTRTVALAAVNSSLTMTDEQRTVAQDPAIWAIGQVRTEPYCPVYVPPTLAFSSPDTVCQGSTVNLPIPHGGFPPASAWTFEGAIPSSGVGVPPPLQYAQVGHYTLRLSVPLLGCTLHTVERRIQVVAAPTVDLPSDTVVCGQASFTLTPLIQNATHWFWEDGSNRLPRTITQTGQYSLRAENGQCAVSDTVHIRFGGILPILRFPDSVCTGVGMPLRVSNALPTDKVRWNSVPEARFLQEEVTFHQAGAHTLRVELTRMGCVGGAEKKIWVSTPPVFSLGSSRFICPDSSVSLRPTVPAGYHFMWENGDPNPARTFGRAGIYHATLANGICTLRDTLRLLERACEQALYYAPSIFCPDLPDNSVFRVFTGASVRQVLCLRIFDRWGGLVFEDKTGNGWSGERAAAGVYVYMALLELPTGARFWVGGEVSVVH